MDGLMDSVRNKGCNMPSIHPCIHPSIHASMHKHSRTHKPLGVAAAVSKRPEERVRMQGLVRRRPPLYMDTFFLRVRCQPRAMRKSGAKAAWCEQHRAQPPPPAAGAGPAHRATTAWALLSVSKGVSPMSAASMDSIKSCARGMCATWVCAVQGGWSVVTCHQLSLATAPDSVTGHQSPRHWSLVTSQLHVTSH